MEELLAKSFANETTAAEQSYIEKWRSESDENAQTYQEYKNLWASPLSPVPAPQDFIDHLSDTQTSPAPLPLLMRSWVKYASAAILVLALGLLFFLNQDASQHLPIQELSDGSIITYRDGMWVEVMAMNERERLVKFDGEAFFEIARDERRPFIVQTPLARIKVLGTSFVVASSSSKTEISVESGTVELIKDLPNEHAEPITVLLHPNETGIVSSYNEGIIKKRNTNSNYLAWKTNTLTFDKTPMSEVSQVLSELYNVSVQFENPTFKECRLTTELKKKKLNEILEIISRSFDVTYEWRQGMVVFSGKGC